MREQSAESEYLRLLQSVASALAEALTPQDVLDAVLEYGVPAAEAESALIALVADDDPDTVEIVAAVGFEASALEPWRRLPLTSDIPFTVAIRTGEAFFFSSSEDLADQFAGVDPNEESHARAILPLLVEGRAIGALVLVYRDDVTFDEERKTRKLTIARQAAQALDRARHYARELALRERMEFLAEASALLGSSLDYQHTLARLVEIAVPRLADWCEIDIIGDRGEIERLAISHPDPAKLAWALELQRRYPLDPDAMSGAPNVIRTGEPEFVPVITDELLVAATQGDEELFEILRELGLRSAITVPLKARGRTLGALTLIREAEGRRYQDFDLTLAQELAQRAALAIDNARLYREAEHRADAARALEEIRDGVLLLDEHGVIRYLNPAAAELLDIDAGAAGAEVKNLVPQWDILERSTRAAPGVVLPLTSHGKERWLAISIVRLEADVVYTFRNVTEERLLEQTRSEFVATASHELRTPVTGIYGAVRTLRSDIPLSGEQRERLLQIIDEEAERLTRIVEQMLTASRLDTGEMPIETTECDVATLLRSLKESAFGSRVVVSVPAELPGVCDESRLRQVLMNLLENAAKYSPGDAEIRVDATIEESTIRIAVTDSGIGLPPGSEERIFEKFYRLDPEQTGGVGGTGLGLYISRELVNRMSGRIHARGNPGGGATFTVELPRGE